MARLEDLTSAAQVRAVGNDGPVEVVAARCFAKITIELTSKDVQGKPGSRRR